MGIIVRNPNPLKALDELPDKPRLGVNPIVAGIALVVIRYCWLRVSPASFQKAIVILSHFFNYFQRNAAPLDLSFLLLYFGTSLIVAGTFIFFRRGVWWWQDKRDEETVTHLRFK